VLNLVANSILQLELLNDILANFVILENLTRCCVVTNHQVIGVLSVALKYHVMLVQRALLFINCHKSDSYGFSIPDMLKFVVT